MPSNTEADVRFRYCNDPCTDPFCSHHNKSSSDHSKDTAFRTTWQELLMCGYMRKIEKEFRLFIPFEIALTIGQLFPFFYPFGDHGKHVFQLFADNTVLKGRPKDYTACGGYVVYADLGGYNDIGLNEGIHTWSVQSCKHNRCYASIGVTKEKNFGLMNNWNHNGKMNEEWNDYFNYEGFEVWGRNQIITVTLNCDNWTVTYYQNGIEFKKDEIKKGFRYFFAMLCCGRFSHFKVVEGF